VVKGSRLYLVDSKGRAVSVTVINEKGKYVFSSLPPDLSVMDPVQEEDTEIKGQSLTGSFIYGPNKTPLPNKTVTLLDADNHVVQTVKTNYFGTVLFTNIPPGADYSVAIAVDDPKIEPEKVYFVSRTGNPVDESSKKLGFRYSLLARDKAKIKNLVVDDTQLRVNIKGILYKDKQGTQPIVHIAVDLLNMNGQVTQTCVTDDHGLFKFSHKVNKEMYTVSITDTTNKEIFIADENGIVLDKMRMKNGKFVYQMLPYIHTTLTELVVDDPWIDLLEGDGNGKESLVIVESIYYKYQDWSVTPEAEVILNKVVSVMRANSKLRVELSSHTDSRGSDAFNMQLSQKRADSGVKYMVSKGIDPKKITGKGYGETRLLNRCGNGVTCTDEEHQVNRRAEFKVVWDK
jgi:outer membrane protein OmpA-like peptidoglycan-associated protein